MVINDAYYTKNIISIQLIYYLSTLYNLNDFNYIIEPSSGNGAFSNHLDKYNLIAIDINPKQDYMFKSDFLTYDLEFLKGKYNLFIGNPPFSFKLLNKFLKKICKYADVIAMVLPITFINNNRLRLIPLKYHLIKSFNLPYNSFEDENGNNFDYNTSFFIFEKRSYNRPSIIREGTELYYKFVKSYEKWDYMIFRVGSKTTKIFKFENNKKYNKYHFYIKLNDDVDKNKFLEVYNNIDFSKFINNTTSFKSIPKYILIDKLNDIYKDL